MRVSLVVGVLASAAAVSARRDHNHNFDQYDFYTQGDNAQYIAQWELNHNYDAHAWDAPPPGPPPGPPPKKPGRPPHFPGKPRDSNETIYTILSEKPFFSRFFKAVNFSEDIVSLLNDSSKSVTLFAVPNHAIPKPPHRKEIVKSDIADLLNTDLDLSSIVANIEALDAFDADAVAPPSKEHLKKIVTAILSYHILPEKHPFKDLKANVTHATSLPGLFGGLNGEPLRLRVGHAFPLGLTINAFSRVEGLPHHAENGIIYTVNHPLLPPPSVFQELFLFQRSFSTFTSALQRVGLTDLVDYRLVRDAEAKQISAEGSPVVTVFAPSNIAFEKLPPKLKLFLFSPFGEHVLKKILQYHIIPSNAIHSDWLLNTTSDVCVHEFDFHALDDSCLEELAGLDIFHQSFRNEDLFVNHDQYNTVEHEEPWDDQWHQGRPRRRFSSDRYHHMHSPDNYWQQLSEASRPSAYDGFSAYNRDTYNAYANYYGSGHASPPQQSKPIHAPLGPCAPPPFFHGPPPPSPHFHGHPPPPPFHGHPPTPPFHGHPPPPPFHGHPPPPHFHYPPPSPRCHESPPPFHGHPPPPFSGPPPPPPYRGPPPPFCGSPHSFAPQPYFFGPHPPPGHFIPTPPPYGPPPPHNAWGPSPPPPPPNFGFGHESEEFHPPSFCGPPPAPEHSGEPPHGTAPPSWAALDNGASGFSEPEHKCCAPPPYGPPAPHHDFNGHSFPHPPPPPHFPGGKHTPPPCGSPPKQRPHFPLPKPEFAANYTVPTALSSKSVNVLVVKVPIIPPGHKEEVAHITKIFVNGQPVKFNDGVALNGAVHVVDKLVSPRKPSQPGAPHRGPHGSEEGSGEPGVVEKEEDEWQDWEEWLFEWAAEA